MRYNIGYSDEQQYVWYRVEKAASRSILEILKEHTEMVPHHHTDALLNPICHNMFDNTEYSKIYQPEWDNYFKFVFVRNPWDRLVSFHYAHIIKRLNDPIALWRKTNGHTQDLFDRMIGFTKGKQKNIMRPYRSFEYFVDSLKDQNLDVANIHYRRQTNMFPLDEVKFVGKFENFDVDIQKVCYSLGIKLRTIPFIGKETKEHYTSMYTNKLIDKVYDLYKFDIDYLEYKFCE